MATTTATVIPQGLALSPDFMAKHDLTPGTSVVVTVSEALRKIPADIDQLIRETRGMLAAKGGGMAEELQQMRRKDERRSQEKWGLTSWRRVLCCAFLTKKRVPTASGRSYKNEQSEKTVW